MSACIDLELSIRRHDEASYAVEIAYSQPGSEVEPRRHGRVARDQLDPRTLRRHVLEPEAYGEQLGLALWADDGVRTAVTEAHSVAAARSLPLRFRLYIDPGLRELHSLRWETLRHPEFGPLATNEAILFSRYLPSADNRPVTLRPQTDLRALVLVANPGDLETTYELAPVDVAAELEQARAGLTGLPLTTLTEPGEANLNRLVDDLRPGCDILYVVAHGALRDNQAYLLLEKEGRPEEADIVAGAVFAERLQALRERPSLVVLASCQSAGTGDESSDALASLGPLLARAGIPAVLAMQGQVQMATTAALMPAFFAQLEETGQIDWALAVARARIQASQPDWWMPVLYMNLKNGRLGWYTPGFGEGDDRANRVKWRGLQISIRGERCTPILGMGLLESWFGSRRAMAQAWADKNGFPLAAHNREALPQVAQFLAVIEKSSDLPRYSFIDYIYNAVWERYGHSMDGAVERLEQPEPEDLNELMVAVWEKHHHDEASDPYSILAGLKLPIYLTADPSDLLLRALQLQPDRQPRVRLCPWNDATRDANYDYEDEVGVDWEPSWREPLVYYLFGRLAVPESLVLTEDDYFDYLIQMTRNREDIPDYVTGALSRTALLMLGFRFDDWDFRSFFRLLMNQRGKLSDDQPHIAAQLEPSEQTILEPKGAKAYLQQYLQNARIDIFWGRTSDFMKAFQQHIKDRR